MTKIFDYSLIRYVGDPVRGEAVNIGVIVIDGAACQSTLVIDNRAPSRLAANWPNFQWRSFGAFARDLRHATGANHQLMLGEGATILEASGNALSAVASCCSNEYALSEPRRYNGISLEEASGRLFRRFVSTPRRSHSRTRHMTRSALRNMMSEIFTGWAMAGSGATIELDVSIPGLITSHKVDLVAYRDGEPEYLLFATPLVGEHATLIRDSVPTVVEDLQARLPQSKFYAVLPDVLGVDAIQAKAATTARAMLARVERLEVVDLSHLCDQFSPRLTVTNSAAG
jgi:hypothetical protein